MKAPQSFFFTYNGIMKSTYYTESAAATIQLGAKLGKTLRPGDTVLLFGELGAGKTHFTKGIAEGLDIEHLVKSPTYAYVNTYPIESGTLFHYDFYRLETGADLTSLGYYESLHDSDAINVVEWADRLEGDLPSRFIRVDIIAEGDTRSLSIDWFYPGRSTGDVVEPYYDEWRTPMHVRDHCKQVASVGRQIATAYIEQGEVVDINLVITSCLLHDLCRVCDFQTLERDKFQEEITDEKWQKWVDLREQYQGQHHADIASDWLAAKGFSEMAEVIRLHRFTDILDEPDSYDTLEKMIVIIPISA
jgi:tRNA threonylcarbamoyladenosine biosynthesis protein TsaE